MSRYDVDAIHMDDYFYPYPVNGLDFPDDASFARYGGGFTNKADWRRSNVNVLIKKTSRNDSWHQAMGEVWYQSVRYLIS